MSTFAISLGIALIICGYLIQQWVAREWAENRARKAERIIESAAAVAAMRAMAALPEPEWADTTPLETKRLRSVPVVPSLSIVPPPAERDEWAELLRAVEVPAQRRAGEWS